MSRRADRRRRERDEGKARYLVDLDQGSVTEGTGQLFDSARAAADLPPKVQGRHRWIITAVYVASDQVLADWSTGAQTILDHENLWVVAPGCYDCEEPYRPAMLSTECPGDPSPRGEPTPKATP